METNEPDKQLDLQKIINEIKIAASDLDNAIAGFRNSLKSSPLSGQTQEIKENLQPLIDFVLELNKRNATVPEADPVTYKLVLNLKAFGLDLDDTDQEKKEKC